jgi:O-antigen/teichoic acid export membrane protein
MSTSTSGFALSQTVPAPAVHSGSLRSNFVWASTGNAVYAASQWGMMSILAHWGSAEMVGEYAMGIALTAPVLMLAQLNLRSVIATDPNAEPSFADYRDLRFLMMAAGLAAIVCMAWAGHTAAAIVMAAGAMQATEWISDIYMGLLQRREQMSRIAVSLVLRGLLSLAGLGAGVVLTGSLAVSLAAVTVARLGVFFFYDRKILTQVRNPASRKITRLRSIAWTALPLGLVLMLGSVAGNMPRYATALYMDSAAVGVFAAIASLGTAANLVVNALGQAATPTLAKLHAAGDRPGFTSVLMKMMLAGAGLCAAAVAVSFLAGTQLLGLAYGAGYVRYASLLAAIMGACGCGYIASLLGYALTAARQFKVQVPLQLATMAATGVGCALLIPRFGLMGAAAGLAAGHVVQAIAEAWLLSRAFRETGVRAQ